MLAKVPVEVEATVGTVDLVRERLFGVQPLEPLRVHGPDHKASGGSRACACACARAGAVRVLRCCRLPVPGVSVLPGLSVPVGILTGLLWESDNVLPVKVVRCVVQLWLAGAQDCWARWARWDGWYGWNGWLCVCMYGRTVVAGHLLLLQLPVTRHT